MTPPFADAPRLASSTAGFANIDQVWEACREDLQALEERIRCAIDSNAPIINHAASYLFCSGGKRIRPLLLILSARLCNEQERQDRLLLLSSAVEYIHTAALLHDDVLDDASMRRGRDTARLLWGNKASILVGDYLYAYALDQVIALGNTAIQAALAETCRSMVEGEVLQLSHRRNVNISAGDYVKIIDHKTACLISTTCMLGALLDSAAPAKKAALAQFGRHLGIAFQLSDDALDYSASQHKLGKALGQDLYEGKITLPMLHLLSACTREERTVVEQIIERGEAPAHDLDTILGLMERYQSVAYTLEESRRYIALAIEELRVFPPSPYRDALEIVADYVVSRDH